MDLFSLRATLGLDTSEYEKGINGAKSKLSSLGSSIKSGAATIAKIGVASIGAATTAIGILTKKSVDAYAEYEQLSGGVKKLFGESASTEIMKYANEAYKTAGMSANQYMEQATSFSAALINSLGGDQMKAAKQTDVAMRAISDNFNTFGGDITNVQNAFQGFAKQNYTMLDNLKLGYGGTKTEMERLIADANEYAKANGMAANLSINSFSDIVTAIDLIQKKQGIAGTTAAEAGKTIEGSLNMTKSAWENLVAGFADPNADISVLMQNVVMSAGTAAKNVFPAVMQAIDGIGQAITQMMPVVTENIPAAFEQIGIPLIQTGARLVTSLITGMINALPGLASAVSQQLPVLAQTITSSLSNVMSSISGSLGGIDLSSAIQMGMDFISKLGEGAVNAVPTLLEMIPTVLEMISTGLMEAMGSFTEMIVPLMEQLGTSLQENIPVLLEAVLPMLEQLTASLRENAGTLISAGLDLILKLAQGIINSIPTLLSYIPQIIINIAGIINDNAPKVLMAGVKLIIMLGKGIIQAVPALIANFPKIISAIIAVWSAINWINLGKTVITAIKNGLAAAPGVIGGALKNAANSAKNAFRSINWASVGRGAINLLRGGITGAGRLILTALKTVGKAGLNAFKSINWLSLGKNIITGIGKGISGAAGIIVNAAKNAAKRAFDGAKKFLGIKSPSRLFRDKIGKNIGLGMALGIEDAEKSVDRAITGLNTDIADADFMSGIPVETRDIDVIGGFEGTPAQTGNMGNTYIFNITNNVSGAENPEDFIDRMVRRLQLRMRTA